MKLETQNKRKYSLKAIDYLSKNGWEFENIKESARDFEKAFNYGCSNDLAEGIAFLLNKCKNWGFYSLRDIKSLDNARKIYRKWTYNL